MSEYDENCGRNIVVDPTNIAMPLSFAGQQDYIAIPGEYGNISKLCHSKEGRREQLFKSNWGPQGARWVLNAINEDQSDLVSARTDLGAVLAVICVGVSGVLGGVLDGVNTTVVDGCKKQLFPKICPCLF